MNKNYSNAPPRSGAFIAILPTLLLFGAIAAGVVFFYKKFMSGGGLFGKLFSNSDRSQTVTEGSQSTMIDIIKHDLPPAAPRHIDLADKIFKVMNTQHIKGFADAFVLSNWSTLLKPDEAKQVRDLLFAPNCVTYADIKQTIVSYGVRRHDNRESNYAGFLWDDHKYSLSDAINNFIPSPTKEKLNKLIQASLAGRDTTKIYYKDFGF